MSAKHVLHKRIQLHLEHRDHAGWQAIWLAQAMFYTCSHSKQQQLPDQPEALVCKEALVGCQYHQVRIIMPPHILHMLTDLDLVCCWPLRHTATRHALSTFDYISSEQTNRHIGFDSQQLPWTTAADHSVFVPMESGCKQTRAAWPGSAY